jgi:NAD(P)-dependent dehydrogenase (short-subunit alcohol dehydrogenase family)
MMPDPFGYAGQRVIVTGCSSGIGHAVARLLVDAGAHVHGLDIVAPDLPLASFGLLDLRDPLAIDATVSALGGPVHALFNCAGVPPMRAPIDVLKVNFIGMRHLTDRVIEHMSPGAAIVGVGSNGGALWRDRLSLLQDFLTASDFASGVAWAQAHPEALADAYRFSKEALAVWTMRHCAETIAQGVRLNCTSPGAVQTPMLDEIASVAPAAAIDAVAQPIGRRSSADEQAWALLMLGSSMASYINGVDLPVDGGFIGSRAVA